ncbi:winged helix-turn-helix transcriptional regulator [Promicromonospora sp. NPDC052451]|uniref:winged helix-turn-helix transcriptional regulator n=1 Tax=Promicromonospora sp. NPDC052451 TaxID=3364407 RepID=UPI0037C8B535
MSGLAVDMFDEICPSPMQPLRMKDKWAPMVLRCLQDGPHRFSELRVPLYRTTAKELTRSLRNLERDGFVSRASTGRAVTYELTSLGRGLLDLLSTVYAWSDEHGQELLDAYDPDGDAG